MVSLFSLICVLIPVLYNPVRDAIFRVVAYNEDCMAEFVGAAAVIVEDATRVELECVAGCIDGRTTWRDTWCDRANVRVF